MTGINGFNDEFNDIDAMTAKVKSLLDTVMSTCRNALGKSLAKAHKLNFRRGD